MPACSVPLCGLCVSMVNDLANGSMVDTPAVRSRWLCLWPCCEAAGSRTGGNVSMPRWTSGR